jgi:hypothetical protein
MALEGSKHTITTIVIQIVPAPISRALRVHIKNNVFSHSAFTIYHRHTLARPIIARCVSVNIYFSFPRWAVHQAGGKKEDLFCATAHYNC